MRNLEILSAILAEELMRNGTQINLDPEEIIWPDGTTAKAPDHEKGLRGGQKRKTSPSSKNGVFGKIVNEYGPKNKTGVLLQSSAVVFRPEQRNANAEEQDENVDIVDTPKKGTNEWYLILQNFTPLCNEFWRYFLS